MKLVHWAVRFIGLMLIGYGLGCAVVAVILAAFGRFWDEALGGGIIGTAFGLGLAGIAGNHLYPKARKADTASSPGNPQVANNGAVPEILSTSTAEPMTDSKGSE